MFSCFSPKFWIDNFFKHLWKNWLSEQIFGFLHHLSTAFLLILQGCQQFISRNFVCFSICESLSSKISNIFSENVFSQLSRFLKTNNLCCLLMQIQICLKLILVNFLLKNPWFPKKIPYKILQRVFIRESLSREN